MSIDWGAMSDDDLAAVEAGDLSQVSDEGLQILQGTRKYVVMGGEGGDVPSITTQAPPEAMRQADEPTFGEQVDAAAQTAATLVTGATGGLYGMAEGGIREGINQAMQGEFGTHAAADAIERAAMERATDFTYLPDDALAQQNLRALEPALSALPPVMGVTNPGAALRFARNPVRDAEIPARSAFDVIDTSPAPAPARPAPPPPPTATLPPPGVARVPPMGDSVGARRTPTETFREVQASLFPVPFEGPSGLTAGQRSRDFRQLQFESDMATDARFAREFQDRYGAQMDTLRSNFLSLYEDFDPVTVDPFETGTAIYNSLSNRRQKLKNRKREAYRRAEEAGQLAALEQLDQLPSTFTRLFNVEGQVPLIRSVRQEAARLGLVDSDGNAMPAPIGRIEELRKFINKWTDFTDDREVTAAREIIKAIDATMDNADTGPLYRIARGLARREFEEFVDTKVVADVTGLKGKTTARRVPQEKAADYVIGQPIEEIRRFRNVLRRGEGGDQAWRDIQARAIDNILQKSTSTQKGSNDSDYLILSNKLINQVRQFDRSGKLEVLFGPDVAQTLRDLAEFSTLILTNPPRAVNYSGTANALWNRLQGLTQALRHPAALISPESAATRGLIGAIGDARETRRLRSDVDRALRGEMMENP